LADSLALRRFVGIALDEYTPTTHDFAYAAMIDLDTHREVFRWCWGTGRSRAAEASGSD